MESIVVNRRDIGGMAEVDTNELIGDIRERVDELNRRHDTMGVVILYRKYAEGTDWHFSWTSPYDGFEPELCEFVSQSLLDASDDFRDAGREDA